MKNHSLQHHNDGKKVYLDKIALYDYNYVHSYIDTKLQIQVTKNKEVWLWPQKNIYVAEADLHLFDDAAKYAGSVSAAVIQALQDFSKCFNATKAKDMTRLS